MDDEERFYFLNPESVSKHLYCSVCQEVFHEPQRAPCGHSFCKKCITQWLKQSKTCPEDRKPVKLAQLHYDFILANIIGDQMVACPFRKLGCTHVGKLEMLSFHKNSCGFNPENLPDFLKSSIQDSSPNSCSTSTKRFASEAFGSDDEVLVSPVKPSLKMRLFNSDVTKRILLCSMFDKKCENDENNENREEKN